MASQLNGIDVIVIGAGPGGLAAAIKAKEYGCEKVLIIDRDSTAGGILKQCIHTGFGLHYFEEDLTGPEYAYRLMAKAHAEGIQIMPRTIALNILCGMDGLEVTICNIKGAKIIHPRAIILAMGCRERTKESLLIGGTRPSGIFTAGVAQRYVNIDGYLPGENVVILGSGDVGLIMARRMFLEGARVKGVVEVMPYLTGLPRNQAQCLLDFNIPLYLSSTVTRIFGRERITAVEICSVDRDRKAIRGTEQIMECDTLLLATGLIPEIEICKEAGIERDPYTGGILINENMATSVPGIFACGNVVHVHNLADQVSLGGEIAGKSAAMYALGRGFVKKQEVHVVPGKNVKYVVPGSISGEKNCVLSLRVTEPIEKVEVCIGDILKKRKRAVVPGEVVEISLAGKELELVKKYLNKEMPISIHGIRKRE